MLPEYFEFSLPTRVVYGIGLLRNPADLLKPFADRRALLVSDAVLNRIGLVERIRESFAGAGVKIVAVYDDVPPNSTIATVQACADLGREHGCDLIIGFGGGSVMDTAKVVNLLLVKGGSVEEHMGAYLLGQEKLLPAILIPTTAGTGSEVTKVAVIADPDNDVKLPFAETQFLPDMAILDPEVTTSMPGRLSAATGMDAMTHAIEAYVDKEWSPASDALALRVVRLISDNLLQACAHPEDLQARGAMLVASCLAGIAFSHSMVGMVHGISHALGGVYHIPHGLANALILPEVMAYNMEARQDRYADLAEAMGVAPPQPAAALRSYGRLRRSSLIGRAADGVQPIDNLCRRWAARAAVQRIRLMNRQLAGITGMPLNLRDAGISDGLSKLQQVATTAMEDGAMLYNPREPERSAVVDIVRRVYRSRETPLKVREAELRPAGATVAREEIRDVFADADNLYQVLGGFYEALKVNPDIGKPLKDSNLCVQFAYRNPQATITIDARGDEVEIYLGDSFEGKPEVTMTMNADIAHYFWHGKVNLVSAITRRQIVAKGNVPKTIKLLPILKPAFELYPDFLRQHGLAEKVVA